MRRLFHLRKYLSTIDMSNKLKVKQSACLQKNLDPNDFLFDKFADEQIMLGDCKASSYRLIRNIRPTDKFPPLIFRANIVDPTAKGDPLRTLAIRYDGSSKMKDVILRMVFLQTQHRYLSKYVLSCKYCKQTLT